VSEKKWAYHDTDLSLLQKLLILFSIFVLFSINNIYYVCHD